MVLTNTAVYTNNTSIQKVERQENTKIGATPQLHGQTTS